MTDYRAVNPALGDWSDIRAIGEDFGLMSDMMIGLQEANATRFNVQTNLKGGAGAFNK